MIELYVQYGEIRDSFTRSDGIWYQIYRIAETWLVGSETITREATSVSGKYRFSIAINDIKFATTNKVANLLCNRLSALQDGQTYSCKEGITNGTSNNKIYIYIEECSAMTVAQFKSWLQENYLVIYYELATPLLIECNVAQTQALNNIYSEYVKGATNVYSTNDIEAIISITTNTINETQAENNRIISSLIEQVRDVVVFEDEEGSNGQIALRKSAKDAKSMEIYFKDQLTENPNYGYIKIDNPNQKNAVLTIATTDSSQANLWIKTKGIFINETLIQNNFYVEAALGDASFAVVDYIYITKVVLHF